MSALIESRNLDFCYANSDQRVIKNLSLDIGAGEFVSVQGPSGSGKSTLLYLLAGFLRPTQGTVSIDGQNLMQLDDVETATFRNRHMGFIFQQFHLLARKSVLENVLLSDIYPVELEHPNKKSVERAKELIAKVGLADKINVPPNKLSGGQQQRVAIARALLHNPRVLFVDEPTGNLDSKTGREIFALLEQLAREGITVVIITHDEKLGARTDRQILMQDGEIIKDVKKDVHATKPLKPDTSEPKKVDAVTQIQRLMMIAWGELQRNRSRSVLTLLGIMFGVAAVSSMVALGDFTKRNVLKSYQEMGVNTFGVNGYPAWTQIKAKKSKTAVFQGFTREADVDTLMKVFPDVRRWSPLFGGNSAATVIYGGKFVENGIVYGINQHGLSLMQRELESGRNFHPLQIESSRSVCVVGSDIKKSLFGKSHPIGQWLTIKNDDRFFSCQIIGALKPAGTGGADAEYKNKSVYLPEGFYAMQVTYWWAGVLHSFLLEAKPGTNIERLSKAVVNFFKEKYGKTGEFYESTNAVMIAQMKKFLSLFTILLLFVATLSLIVGCIGVSNMMTVSVTERIGEFGVRKALGATNQSLRKQILCESTILCLFAGTAGVVMGFMFQQTAIYAASKLFPKLPYGWEFNIWAVLLAMIATFLSGYISGLSAAEKVEQLSVAEVLRSE